MAEKFNNTYLQELMVSCPSTPNIVFPQHFNNMSGRRNAEAASPCMLSQNFENSLVRQQKPQNLQLQQFPRKVQYYQPVKIDQQRIRVSASPVYNKYGSSTQISTNLVSPTPTPENAFENHVQDGQANEDEYDDASENELVRQSLATRDRLKALSTQNRPADEQDSQDECISGGYKELLIEWVRKYQCIWDMKSHLYKDKTKKKLAWKKIHVDGFKEKINVALLKNVWKNLREAYFRCLSNRAKKSTSGSKARKLPTCNYFDILTFLSDSSSESYAVVDESNISLNNDTTRENNNDSTVPNGVSTDKEEASDSRQPINPRKRKRTSLNCDEMIVKSLMEVNKQIDESKGKEEHESSNFLFCKSLVSILDDLTPAQNMEARIKIQQVLFELKFNA